MKKTITIKGLIFVIAIIVLWWPGEVGILRYTDEIITLYGLAILLIQMFKTRYKNKEITNIIAASIVMLVIGMISSALSGIGQPIFAILVDALSLMKYPIAYILFRYYVSNRVKEDIVNLLCGLCKITVFCCFVMGIMNLFVDFGMSYDIRYGIRSFKFFYNNPGSVVALMVFCYAIFVMKGNVKKQYTVLLCICILLTLRAAGIGTVGVIILCQLILKGKLKLKHMIGAGLCATLLGAERFVKYFLSEATLRSELLRGGIYVMKKYFPLGSGYASYGSDMAFNYYSPLYYELGFDKYWGFSPATGHVINDNFWPMLMAQFGICGVVCFLIILYNQFVSIIKSNIGHNRLSAAVTIYVMLVISSVGAAVYTGKVGLLMAIVFAIVLNDVKTNKVNEE